MVDVSFVIVSWNTKYHLLQCLESIGEHASGLSREVLVVDNASDDGSPEAVAAAFPEVTLIRNEMNYGFARGNNVGIQESCGRYLCLVNSDVILLPRCIEVITAFMDEHQDVGMLGPRILNADRTIQSSCMAFPTIRSRLVRALALESLVERAATPTSFGPCEVDALTGCFWFLRREAVNEVGLLDERFFLYCEDLDWCRRFKRAGWGVVYYPKAQAIHFGGASSANAPDHFLIELEKSMLQYWQKHHGTPARCVVWLLLILGQIVRLTGGAAIWAGAAPASVLTRLLLRKPEGASPRKAAATKVRQSLALLRWLLLRSHRTGVQCAETAPTPQHVATQ